MSDEIPERVQLRQDLQQSRQQHQGKPFLVLKDPVARRYFRFTESQAAILELLDTPTDAEDLAARASAKLGGTISPATIAAFLDSLDSRNLLDTPAVRERLGTAISPNKHKQSSVLYKQVASFDPEPIFNWLLPRTRWAFTSAFHVFGCFLILCGVTIFYLHWDELRAATPNLLNIWTILMVWPIVFSVSAYHEFSHGLTCRHFGGQVKEVGFMLIYFSPAFYCDVSDAWMFRERRQRMLVTFAGGYAQLMLWGLCTIVWRITDPDTYINHIMLVVVLFSGLQTLFNFNPLIKLDGYYMLSDYLEVPNLRSKAFGTLWNWITRNSKRKAFREERAQLIYGACALLFSTTLLLMVYSRIYTWATGNWATAGLVGFAAFATITLRRTAVESMSGLKTLVSHVAVRKYRNALIFLASVLVATFGHWELKINAEFKVLAQSEYMVHAATNGLVTEVLVREGVHVHQGDLLARTTDYEKQSSFERIAGELAQRKSTLERLRAGATPLELQQLETRIAAKKTELDNARRYQEERSRLEEVLAQRKKELEGLVERAAAQKQLFDEELVAKVVWLEAQNAVEIKERELAQAEATIRAFNEKADRETDLFAQELAALQSDLAALKAGNRPELIRETQAEVDKLETLLASLNQEIAKSEIHAPIDGIVATPFPERKVGTKLVTGEDFIRLVDTTGVTAEMLVPEKELEDVKAGNIVWLTVRSFPDQQFQGRVDSIAPVADTVGNQQMIKVRTRLANEENRLKPDMTGVARIYCGQRRIISILTYRVHRWVKTEFVNLLP